MSNEKVGTKHLTQRPREPEGSRGVEFDRHSEPWEVMNLLWQGHKNLTELDNCYNHTPQGVPEDSIDHEEVEAMIRNLMPVKDIEYTLRFVVRAKDPDAVGGAELKDALHALLTEAGEGYVKRHCVLTDTDFVEPEDHVPTCRPKCHECGYSINPTAKLAVIDGHEYHAVCWHRAMGGNKL